MLLMLLLLALIWCVCFAKSEKIGKVLYQLNNWVESKLAGLIRVQTRINNNSYYYYTNGRKNKPLMVLLHGFSADKNIWLKFAKHASKDYCLVIPDCMGHGEAPYDPHQLYSAQAQADYLKALVELHYDKQELIVVGNSMGGMIAAIMGQQYGIVSKIVLLDPAGAKSEFALAHSATNTNHFLHKNYDSFVGFYELSMHKPPFIPPSVLRYIAQTNYIDKYAQYEHMFRDFFNVEVFFDQAILGKNNPVESLVVWGEKDKLLPVSDIDMWGTLLEGKKVVIPDIGHVPMVECPKQTYSLIH